MSEASETPDIAVREWCCGTLITEPHRDGCGYEPKPEDDFYTGPVVVTEPPAGTPLTEAELVAVAEHDAKPELTPTPAPEPAPETPKWEHQSEWAHDWLDFKGDRLAIRRPPESAVNSFIMITASGVEPALQSGVISEVLHKSLSPESFGRVLYRNIDPDDPEYTVTTMAELAGELIRLSTEKLDSDAKTTPAQ